MQTKTKKIIGNIVAAILIAPIFLIAYSVVIFGTGGFELVQIGVAIILAAVGVFAHIVAVSI